MATVKVILQQDVPNLGHTGDIKQVAPGYFRNYLLPRGLAVEASEGRVRALQSNSATHAARLARSKSQASEAAQKLQGVVVRIPVRVGDQGRIFGSVTNKDIAEALDEQAQVSVDRHKIELREPLKSIGIHEVPVKLEHGEEAQVRVELIPSNEGVPT